MKAKLAFLVLYAILSTSVNCIKVVDNPDENNSTTIIPPSVIETVNESNTTESENLNLDKEVRTIEDNGNDDKLPESKVTTPANVHKIPPTLQNVMKVEPSLKEKKPEKSLKDFA